MATEKGELLVLARIQFPSLGPTAEVIVTDRRDDRLRFGFGCYHTPDDISRGVARIVAALR